jgi:hypothetical protein
MTASTVTITFGSASVFFGNVGVGIYSGQVNGVATDFICDDFYTDISDGQSWNANVGNTDPATGGLLFDPADPADVGAPLPGSITQQQDYNMIGYLADQIFADPVNSLGNWDYDSFAIWSLNDSAAWTDAQSLNISGQVQALLISAYDNRNNSSSLTVYTPTPSIAGQEFLSLPTSTPEPSPLWLVLFGGGVCVAAGWRRKRVQ